LLSRLWLTVLLVWAGALLVTAHISGDLGWPAGELGMMVVAIVLLVWLLWVLVREERG
jgi:cytochrome c oxidase assembly factor CtaG